MEPLKSMLKYLKSKDDFAVVCHYDADGLTAGAIASLMLERLGKKKRIQPTRQLDEERLGILKDLGENYLFVDLGSGQIPLIEKNFSSYGIIDHHETLSQTDKPHFNAHLVGWDGAKEISGSGDIRTLAKTIKQLEKEKIELQHQMENKQIQMRDIDEERKRTLAKKNQLEEKYDAIGEEMKKEKNKVEKLSKTREKLEDRISDLEAKESPSEELNNLKRENRLLRESLEEKNKRMNQLSKNLGVLKTVFDKYTDIIEEKESKTAEELKRLVQPNNQGIISVAKAYNTPKKAFEFVRDNISEVTPNISATYWLTVDDMLRLRAADTEDESILLCSLLRTLGENAHVIVVELDRGTVKTIVSLEDRILDPSIKSNFDDYVGISEEEALKKYMFNGEFVKQVLYRFNDKNYQTQGEQ